MFILTINLNNVEKNKFNEILLEVLDIRKEKKLSCMYIFRVQSL